MLPSPGQVSTSARCTSFFRRIGWLVLLALLGSFSPLLHADVKNGVNDKDKKDKDQRKYPVPQALERSANFVAGKSVDIELEASVASLKQVEFIIRQAPVNGTLSAVRPHPKETNKAIVTYTHAGVDAPLSDRFTFACRVGDSLISAPATVTLTGQKFQPILSIENVTAMGKVFLGGESSLRVAVKNTGPADFASDLTWEAPWRGPPHLELKAGELAEVGVTFQPTAPGIFRLDRLLQPGENSSRLLLYGECVRALTVSPSHLVLVLKPDTGTREGSFILANGLSSQQTVKFKMPPRLMGPPSVEVPAAGQTKVVLSLPETDQAAFKGEMVVVSADGSTQEVKLEAEAKPALLQLTQPADGVLDLGAVPQGGEAHGTLVLKNNGGLPAVVQAFKSATVQVTPSGRAIRIEPGAEGKFQVTVKGEQMGHLQTEAHLQGSGLLLRVPVKMNVTAKQREAGAPLAVQDAGPVNSISPNPAGSPKADEHPEASTPLYKNLVAYFAASGLPIPKENINPNLERVHDIEIRDRSANSITIAWNKPSVPPAGWIIEIASWARIPTGELVKAWTPMKTWDPVNVGDRYVGARLKSLAAGSSIEIRLMGVDRDGKVSEPSTFAMETSRPWHMPSWVWTAGWSIALAAVLFGLYRIREGYWDPTWKPLRRLLRL